MFGLVLLTKNCSQYTLRMHYTFSLPPLPQKVMLITLNVYQYMCFVYKMSRVSRCTRFLHYITWPFNFDGTSWRNCKHYLWSNWTNVDNAIFITYSRWSRDEIFPSNALVKYCFCGIISFLIDHIIKNVCLRSVL